MKGNTFSDDGGHNVWSKMLAGRPTSNAILQQNPTIGETPDEVHISCRKCVESGKYDLNISCLTASVCKLFE